MKLTIDIPDDIIEFLSAEGCSDIQIKIIFLMYVESLLYNEDKDTNSNFAQWLSQYSDEQFNLLKQGKIL